MRLTLVKELMHSRLVSVKHNLPSKIKFIIVELVYITTNYKCLMVNIHPDTCLGISAFYSVQ